MLPSPKAVAIKHFTVIHNMVNLDFKTLWPILIYIDSQSGEESMQSIAKIFKNGRSQAIRLPKEFRFQ